MIYLENSWNFPSFRTVLWAKIPSDRRRKINSNVAASPGWKRTNFKTHHRRFHNTAAGPSLQTKQLASLRAHPLTNSPTLLLPILGIVRGVSAALKTFVLICRKQISKNERIYTITLIPHYLQLLAIKDSFAKNYSVI